MFPSLENYNPDLSQAEADVIRQQMTLKSLVQLDMLREKAFLSAMDQTASAKEVLSLCEHLVKSTDLENISRRPAEGGQALVNFGLVFHSPGGDIKVVGNVQASSVEQIERKEPAQRPAVIEVEEWGSLVGD